MDRQDPGRSTFRLFQPRLTTDRDAATSFRLGKLACGGPRYQSLRTPVYTLAGFDAARRQARLVVSSDPARRPGEPVALAPEMIEPMSWTFQDGFARATPIYLN